MFPLPLNISSYNAVHSKRHYLLTRKSPNLKLPKPERGEGDLIEAIGQQGCLKHAALHHWGPVIVLQLYGLGPLVKQLCYAVTILAPKAVQACDECAASQRKLPLFL